MLVVDTDFTSSMSQAHSLGSTLRGIMIVSFQTALLDTSMCLIEVCATGCMYGISNGASTTRTRICYHIKHRLIISDSTQPIQASCM
jgi:hypothetical protein